ncbi:hypothetical protein ACFPYI_01975 [Halomarina salina]|uniref:Uncharacterized protein n=1 Tax=Halomarina salina TaxID=1872699 RepID=A0ABD5RHN4_9EURY|nr:hypothetical protein [Halomarina salina]
MNLQAVAKVGIAVMLSVTIVVLSLYAAATPSYSVSSQLLWPVVALIGALLGVNELAQR